MIRKQWFRAGIIAGITALAFCAAPLFVSGLQRPDAARLLAPQRSPYRGVINVWQLSDFNAPYGSKAALLEKAARRVERRYAGVYYEVENITSAEYEKRLQQGEMPDVLSFSSGWQGESIYFEPLAQADALRAPFSAWHRQYPQALPWMAVSAVLLRNTELTEAAPKAETAASLLEDMKGGVQKDVAVLCAAREALLPLAGCGAQLLQNGMLLNGCENEDADAWGLFRQEKAAYFWGGRARLITLEALAKQGKGPAFAQIALPPDWPRWLDIQYLAVCKTADADKLEMCKKLLQEAVCPAIQQAALQNMGCIPVAALDTEDMPPVDKEVYAAAEGSAALPPFMAADAQGVQQRLSSGNDTGLLR